MNRTVVLQKQRSAKLQEVILSAQTKWARDSHLSLPAPLNIASRCSFRWEGRGGSAVGGFYRLISCVIAGKISVGVGTTLVSVCSGVARLSDLSDDR